MSLERAFLRRLGGGCQTPVGAHYVDGTFYIFHSEIGHTQLEFEFDSLDEIDAIIERIFSGLKFKQ